MMSGLFPRSSSDEDYALWIEGVVNKQNQQILDMLEWYMREVKGEKDFKAYRGRKINSFSAKRK